VKKLFLLILTAALSFGVGPAPAFEGRINATLTRGGQTQTFLYTIGTNDLRLERGETDRPYPRNIFHLETGELTLLFPNNRSFIRLQAADSNAAPQMPGMPLPPGGLLPGIGPQSPAVPTPPVPGLPARPNLTTLPPDIGPQAGATRGAIPGAPPMAVMPGMGTMPMMPMPGMDMELRATGEKTNLLGYVCLRYELKQRGEVMEIWATDQLLPFQTWQQNQPARFGPRMMEEQWAELVKARKLFPLLAILKFENGPERLRFAVTAVTPEKIADPDCQLFQPPADYHQLDPLPF